MELHLKIPNPEGLHARPAGILAKKASEFQSTVHISAGGQIKSAKSIMALMSLGLKMDQEFTLIIDGPDAESASLALAALVNSGFKS
jgi:phosphotransferase system HPr (HPr) family protein